MTWMAAAIGGSAVLGAGASIYGANSAANAQQNAAGQSADTSRRNMLLQLGIAEPQRNVGYQALGDMASLYGYSVPQYSTQQQLARGLTPLGAKVVKKGIKGGMGVDQLSQMGTLGQIKPRAMRRLQRAGLTAEDIQQLQGMGGGSTGNIPAEGQPAPTGQAGNMSRFFASPDYEFRRGEGMRGLEQSAAARGGAFSGDALKALSEYNSNIASSEFGNYWNRLSQMAGMGQTANNQVSGAANTNTNNLMQSQQQQGDARASGVLGATNGVVNALNTGAQNWMMGKYLQNQQPVAQPSAYGPYRSGYRFPGG